MPVLLLLAVMAARAGALEITTFDSRFTGLRWEQSRLLGLAPDGSSSAVSVRNGRLVTVPFDTASPASSPVDILPDGIVVSGRGDIRRAWLGGATRRYGHAVLGDAVEASRLLVVDDQGRRHNHELPPSLVYEDRYPRFLDLEGFDGDELMVVRSDVDKGAGIVVYGLENGNLVELAASQTLGRRYRWLNIAGAGDFDGDGRVEIAAVVTPHIGGILTIFRRSGNQLVPVFERRGFSNHRLGSPELSMSVVRDLNTDGIPDIAVPDAARRMLVLLTIADGTYRELGRFEHDAPIDSGIFLVDLNGDSRDDLVYMLDDGTIVWLTETGSGAGP